MLPRPRPEAYAVRALQARALGQYLIILPQPLAHKTRLPESITICAQLAPSQPKP